MSQKRCLPSWMSSRDPECKKPKDEENKQKIINVPSNSLEHGKMLAEPISNTIDFSKLMEGVVFVLSGFVNPERSTLRSQALSMGATYQPDWNSDSTLLISAFPNTPKFRQVETNSGTIVSKEWITQCYLHKKLVDIEQYLMHAGKPWRKNNAPQDSLEKQIEKKPETSGTSAASTKKISVAKEPFSVNKVKKWARDDLIHTISWLENQEEKPEPGEIKRIAAEGVLTCLQDAIDSLEQNQEIGTATEMWSYVPHVVKELGKMETSSKKEKEAVCKKAKWWKEIYEVELGRDDESVEGKSYDSDETVEMTEEEIEVAYMNVVSLE